MLALKDLHLGTKPVSTCFANLPAEILIIILSHIYNDDGASVRNIRSCSKTNHALRNAAAPLLFQTLVLSIESDRITDSSLVRLRHVLQKNSSIAHHIRHLKQILAPPDRTNGQSAAMLTDDAIRTDVVETLRLMTGLRRVSYVLSSSANKMSN